MVIQTELSCLSVVLSEGTLSTSVVKPAVEFACAGLVQGASEGVDLQFVR